MTPARRSCAAPLALMAMVLSLACGGFPYLPGQQAVRPAASSPPGKRCGPVSAAKGIHLSRPRGVVLDRSCNLYIADSLSYRVLRIDPAGSATVVAGEGTVTPQAPTVAVRARLGAPQALAADLAGNVYIGTDDARVLRLSPDGTIRTVAGNGGCGTGGPPSGSAAQAAVCVPTGLALDAAGDLYVADGGNRYLTKVSPAGSISVVAGIGERESSGDDGLPTQARIGDPQGLAVEDGGALYLSDGFSTTVRKIAGGKIWRFAGGGAGSTLAQQPALQADIYPQGLALDGGDLYVADDLHNQVRKVTAAGLVETVAGNGTPGWSGDHGSATAARLKFPRGVALDAVGNLYIADTGNDHVRRVSRDGVITTVL